MDVATSVGQLPAGCIIRRNGFAISTVQTLSYGNSRRFIHRAVSKVPVLVTYSPAIHRSKNSQVITEQPLAPPNRINDAPNYSPRGPSTR
jgi:hypothetical protein